MVDKDTKNIYKFIDLFAGTGAFSLALEKNENENITFECVFSNDMIKSSKDCFDSNFPNNTFNLNNLNDIKTNDIPKHNILCGGFPCQPFSIAGEQKGFKDERANVFSK